MDLKNITMDDLKQKLASVEKKTLIKFGSGFGAIVLFLIIYYIILNPMVKERKAKLFNYKLPTSDLLDSPIQVKTDISEEVLRARGVELVDALSSFGVEGKIVEIKKPLKK